MIARVAAASPSSNAAPMPVRDGGTLTLASLSFSPVNASAKGSVDASFRQYLFASPFGTSFYRAMMAVTGPTVSGWDGWFKSAEPPSVAAGGVLGERRVLPILAWTGVGIAVGAATGGVIFGVMARQSHREYEAAVEPPEALSLKRKTEDQACAANLLFGAAAIVGAASVTALVWDHVSGGSPTSAFVPDPSLSYGVVGPRYAAIVVGTRW